jgi:hypothetical protein
VVRAREYHEEKEALKAAEEQAKFDRKVKRAATALRTKKGKEEKEARAAVRQLVKDLTAATPAAKKALKKKAVLVGSKAKKTTSTVPKKRKAPIKAILPIRSPVKSVVVALAKEIVASGVVVSNRSGHIVRLPQRFK